MPPSLLGVASRPRLRGHLFLWRISGRACQSWKAPLESRRQPRVLTPQASSDTWSPCVRKLPAKSWRSSIFDSCPTCVRRFIDRLTSSPTRYFSASSCAVAGSALLNANAANCDSPTSRWTGAVRSPSNDVTSLTAISRFSRDRFLSALVRRRGQPNRRDSRELIQARIERMLSECIKEVKCVELCVRPAGCVRRRSCARGLRALGRSMAMMGRMRSYRQMFWPAGIRRRHECEARRRRSGRPGPPRRAGTGRPVAASVAAHATTARSRGSRR